MNVEDIESTAVNQVQLATIVKAAITDRAPIFIWGAPGIGKSSIVRQCVQGMDRNMIDLRAPLLDTVDLRGLPFRDAKSGKTIWSVPQFLPTKATANDVVFCDELNAAPRMVQVGFYQLILDRQCGEYTLPEGVAMLAAGNRETDGAVTYQMPTALASRFVTHVTLEVGSDEWLTWALQQDLHFAVVQYIRMRPDMLHVFDPKGKDRTFPCPRTWEFVSRILGMGLDDDITYTMLSGAIGRGPATEFMAFYKTAMHIQSPDVILGDPEHANVPDDPALTYATIGALARKATQKNMDAIVRFSRRLSDKFSVLLITDVITLVPECRRTEAFITWGSENNHIFR